MGGGPHAHGSVRRRRRNQITGRISPAPGSADCSAGVKVELGPARIRASLTGAPDRDTVVTSPELSDTAEGLKRELRALCAVASVAPSGFHWVGWWTLLIAVGLGPRVAVELPRLWSNIFAAAQTPPRWTDRSAPL